MNKRKRYPVFVLALVLLLGSTVFSEAEEANNNLYPNPQPGLATLKEEVYKYIGDYDYYFQDLTLNGPAMNGNVITKQGNTKGIIQVYTVTVKNEGMVSINLSTEGTLDKAASLYVDVTMNDPRTNQISVNNDVQITLSDKPNHPYVEKNYIFYAYPGVYYFDVNGKDRSGGDYKQLYYSINATQETYEEQYGASMGNVNHPDFPNYLGSTTLSESLSINSTKNMKNWRRPSAGGSISGVYVNSSDKFTFTAAKSGTVNVKIVNEKSTILDTYLAAYHSSARSTAFQPVIKVNVSQPNVTSPLRTECLYGQERMDTFKVTGGETYNVEIIGSNHPMRYSLDFSYGTLSTPIPSGGNTSVTASSWALAEINQSIDAGLQTTKMMNNDFKSYATREEFAELVMKLYDQLGGTSVSVSSNPFTDTTNKEILRAKESGIINGTSTTTFGPNEHLTREQLCVMILRSLDATGTDYNQNMHFQKKYKDETDISSWALTSVRTLNSYKIINGSGDRLDPKSTVTKEVAILMMYRAYEMFK